MIRLMLRIGFIALFAIQALLFLTFPSVDAETCLSPFVKRLDRPEKVLYVFCVDADAKDHDFLAVIDFDQQSHDYGQVITTVPLPNPGASGNEPITWVSRPMARCWAPAACSATSV